MELDTALSSEENMKVEKVSKLINGPDDFRRITSSSDVVMVNFFAPWCHWCQSLAPIYEGVAQRVEQGPLQSHVVVAKVDCTNPANFPVCRDNRIQAYPTVIMSHLVVRMMDSFTPRSTNKFIHYHGARTVDAMIKGIKDALDTTNTVVASLCVLPWS